MRVIYISPGPLHLFFTTGVNFFWAMRKADTKFVFIVPAYYAESADFQKILQLSDVLHVIYLPSIGRIKLHRYYALEFPRLIAKFPPAMLFMHSCFFIDNLYLLQACRNFNVQVFIYQSGRFALDWDNEWWLIRQQRIRSILAEHKYAAKLQWLLPVGFFISDWTCYFLDNFLLPAIFLRTAFTPSINVRNGRVLSKTWLQELRAIFLCYCDPEIEAMRRILGPFNCTKIRHPAADNAGDVMSYLYGLDFLRPANPIILVVPSWGWLDSLLLEGNTPTDVARDVARCWIEALELLLTRFPGRDIKFKLHPSSHGDPVLGEITQMIKTRFCERIDIVLPSISAERFALNAEVVVGDVTSVLWWCGLISKKYVISLDIFGYPFGNMMKDYPGLVTVVSDVREIASITENVLDESYFGPGLSVVLGK